MKLINSSVNSYDGYKLNKYEYIPSNIKLQLFLVIGRAEIVYKYSDIIKFFVDQNIAVISYDHRGQGFNKRISPNNELCTIDSFKIYEKDMFCVLNTLDKNIPTVVLSISMGAAIILETIKENTSLDFIKGYIFVAPFIGFHQNIPLFLIRALSTLKMMIDFCRKKESYFWGQKGFIKKIVGKNANTSDILKNDMYFNLYDRYANTKLGGVSSKWICAAIKTISNINANKIHFQTDSIFLLASDDNVVSFDKSLDFVKRNKDAKVQFYILDDSRHDILIENDRIFEQAIRIIYEFITSIKQKEL